uniref:NADH-cytochrome b5 reductase n=1 Tax=Arcella intermedia TaxID=1963864 RepID=A0A6B2LBU7_9EUKA
MKANKPSYKKGLSGALVLAGTALVTYSYFQNSKAFADQSKEALSPKEFKEFTLFHKHELTRDTSFYRFSLGDNEVSNTPTASCVLVQTEIDGKNEIRPYTPVSKDGSKYLDFVVKSYPNGKISKHFSDLIPGDTLKIQGPHVTLPYTPNMKKHIGMIAGGTGITPMYQVIRTILENPQDHTKITLLFGNITEQDIILKKQLDELVSKHHERFTVHYMVDRPSSHWKGLSGYVTPQMAKLLMPPPSDDNLVLVCGPPPMLNVLAGPKAPNYQQGELKGILKDLGYNESQVHKF